jgi:hypothetical protein
MQAIGILIIVFVCYQIFLVVIRVLGSALVYIGATLILVLDYITRPLSWFNVSSPDIAWAILGLIIGACFGLIRNANQLALLPLIPRLKAFVVASIAAIIGIIAFSYSLVGNYGLMGEWKGTMHVVALSIPASLQVSRLNSAVMMDCQNRKAPEVGCQPTSGRFSGTMTISFPSATKSYFFGGYLIPGTNQFGLLFPPTSDSKNLIKLGHANGKVHLGFKHISGIGDVTINGKQQPYDFTFEHINRDS